MSTDDQQRRPDGSVDPEVTDTSEEGPPAQPVDSDDFDNDTDDEYGDPSRWRRVDPDEVEEYDEWRQERRQRGRKRKGKGGDRRRRQREEDFF